MNEAKVYADGFQKLFPTQDEFLDFIKRDMAAAVVVSAGFFKGKTLGQIAIEKPQSLTWYVSDYKGPDNLLRAGARFLLDAAKAAA